jgi:hypothetical protein
MKGLIKPCAALWVLVFTGCASTTSQAASTAADGAGSSTAEAAMSADSRSSSEPEAAVVTAVEASVDAATRSTLPAFYTEDQAIRGEGFFRETCLSCHASSEFRGSTFERQWTGRTVRDLYAAIAYSMPDDNPGGLPAQTYTDVIAYILELNDYPAGAAELKPGRAAMRAQPLWP